MYHGMLMTAVLAFLAVFGAQSGQKCINSQLVARVRSYCGQFMSLMAFQQSLAASK
jgi:hypothetical protein